ncbi:MAG: hypothetical protein ACJ796_08930 [Gemmatimonadaceae bacterium]
MTTPRKLDKLEEQLGELIASRSRTANRTAKYTKYADDPIGFIRDVLKGDPWSKQVEIADALIDDPLIAVQSANGVGKDWLAAALALWWVYARRGLVLITAPSERQVHEILMKTEIARFWHRAKLPGQLFTNALRLPEEVESDRVGILAQTSSGSSGASKLTGHHAPRILVIISECQGVEPFAWEGLLSCAVSDEDRVLAIGNPVSPDCGMFYTITRPSSSWKSFTISAFDHPNVVHNDKRVPGGVTRAFIKRIRDNFGGINSPAYIARVLGQFPETSAHALVTRAWLEAAVRRHESGALDEDARASDYAAAVDPARFGPDSSCLALRRGPVLKLVETWQGSDLMETCGKVVEILRARHLAPNASRNLIFTSSETQYGPGIASGELSSLVIDTIGLGGGVHDRLAELRWPVSSHNSARPAFDKDRFYNRRAEVFWTLRALLEDGLIALPRNERLFEELLQTQYQIDSSGKIRIEPKDDLKTRIGRSPDLADAVSMCFGTIDATAGGGDMIDL